MSSVENVPERKYALAGVSTSICPACAALSHVELVPDRHEAELKRSARPKSFHWYDGASHRFFYYHTPHVPP